ncbi:MAG: hypothetical protein ACXW4P_05995 [Thermoanaerobaculia bacterium]
MTFGVPTRLGATQPMLGHRREAATKQLILRRKAPLQTNWSQQGTLKTNRLQASLEDAHLEPRTARCAASESCTGPLEGLRTPQLVSHDLASEFRVGIEKADGLLIILSQWTAFCGLNFTKGGGEIDDFLRDSRFVVRVT